MPSIKEEQIHNKFIDWISKKQLSSFPQINGKTIVSKFIDEVYGPLSDDSEFDYVFFINDNRELIGFISEWLLTYSLDSEGYEKKYQHYLETEFIPSNRRSYFSTSLDAFTYNIIKLNYYVDKKSINKDNLKQIFDNVVQGFLEKKGTTKLEKRIETEKGNKLDEKARKRLERQRYKRKRFKRDPCFRILHRLRTRILLVLNGKKKHLSSMNLLGCSPSFFKDHLEAQFKPGMTWENYGVMGWHVDHIRPCASFDLSVVEQQKACFHYTNLQPLWWFENLQKGCRTDYLYHGKQTPFY